MKSKWVKIKSIGIGENLIDVGIGESPIGVGNKSPTRSLHMESQTSIGK